MAQPSPSTHRTLLARLQYRSSSQDEKEDVRDVMGDDARVRHGSSVLMVLVCDRGMLSRGLHGYRRVGDRHDRSRFGTA